MPVDDISKSLLAIANKYNADIYSFIASVDFLTAKDIISKIRNTKHKAKNCVLVLTTGGGDPDAGYRIIKTLKREYSKVALFVFSACKSTGTLMALGADEIVMSETGEFGPLDVQMIKDDELSRTSGLTLQEGLVYINKHLFKSFEKYFLTLKRKSGHTITTRTAAEIAGKLAIGMISPIASQIDPNKLGETQRAVSIAFAYGTRLTDRNELIVSLISDYPSHGFVIDIDEAKELFDNIKDTEKEESDLEQLLFESPVKPMEDKIINAHSKKYLLDLEEKMKQEGNERKNGYGVGSITEADVISEEKNTEKINQQNEPETETEKNETTQQDNNSQS